MKITAPPATDPTDPLVIVFELIAEQVPAGATADTIQIFRNGSTDPVLECKGIGVLARDPCVSLRETLVNGNVRITVLSSTASVWDFGVSGDETSPQVTSASFTPNPKSVTQTTVLNVTGSDDSSGVVDGEFFIGADPGQGNARPLDPATLSATVDDALAPGVYPVGVRVLDAAGNWSDVFTVFLVVYDPEAGFVSGGGWIVPKGAKSDPGDLLPGICEVELGCTEKANFGFVVRYETGAATVPGGNLEFHYNVGQFHLHSTEMQWLVVTNLNGAKFQGTARIDGAPEGLYPFRVDARDGDGNGGTQTDTFVIKIWEPGADPDVDPPKYKASGEVLGGQIVLHRT